MGKKLEEMEILDNLQHSGAAYRAMGIAQSIQRRADMPSVISILKKLVLDPTQVLGRPISSYAVAALDILGIEKFTGHDQEIIDLINGLPIAFAT